MIESGFVLRGLEAFLDRPSRYGDAVSWGTGVFTGPAQR
jgi:hypothetical protein